MAEFDNAVLVEVASPGPLASNGDAGVPVPVWTGRAGGYLKRGRNESRSNNADVLTDTITFTLLRTVADVASLISTGSDAQASSVVIDDMRTGVAVRARYRVNAFENRAAGTIVDSLKLTLEIS